MKLSEAFATLNLPEGASEEEAKKQYRKLTKEYHPDVNKDPGAEDRFKKINNAYECIKNGETPEREEMPWNNNHSPFNPFSPFGHQHIQANNVQLHTTISFAEAVLGCKKDLKFTRDGKCNDCDGQGSKTLNNGCDKCNGKGTIINRQGYMIFTRTCGKCNGKIKTEACKACNNRGAQTTDVAINVSIPGGIVNGNILRLASMGNFAGSFGSIDQYTDALLHINVIQEEGLELINGDVVSNLDISLLEALTGCNKTIKTILGDKEININSKSKNKEEVIIPNLGVNKIGNQRVILDVKYPDNIDKLIDLLKE